MQATLQQVLDRVPVQPQQPGNSPASLSGAVQASSGHPQTRLAEETAELKTAVLSALETLRLKSVGEEPQAARKAAVQQRRDDDSSELPQPQKALSTSEPEPRNARWGADC